MREISGEARNEPRTAHIRVRTVRVSPHESALPVTRVKPRDCAGEVVVLTLRTAISRIGTQRAEAGRGEPEGVHRLRAAIRRLRSELRRSRTLSSHIGKSNSRLSSSGWRGYWVTYATWIFCSAVSAKPRSSLKRLRTSNPALSPVLKGLEQRRRRAAKAVSAALEMERYRALIASLERAVEHPPLEKSAGEACRVALPAAARAAWHRLRKAARDLKTDDADERFHEARKRAKSARYTSELIAPLLGRRATRGSSEYIRLTTRVQDALGEHQDALITAGELERALSEHPDDSALAECARQVLEDQRERARGAHTNSSRSGHGSTARSFAGGSKEGRPAESHPIESRAAEPEKASAI